MYFIDVFCGQVRTITTSRLHKTLNRTEKCVSQPCSKVRWAPARAPKYRPLSHDEMTVATIYSVSQAGAEPSMASVPALAKFMENGNLAGSQGPIRRRGAGWRSATAQRWVAHLSPTEQNGSVHLRELTSKTKARLDRARSRLAGLVRDRELDDDHLCGAERGPILRVRRCCAHLPRDERRRCGAKRRNDGREQCARADERATRSVGARGGRLTAGYSPVFHWS